MPAPILTQEQISIFQSFIESEGMNDSEMKSFCASLELKSNQNSLNFQDFGKMVGAFNHILSKKIYMTHLYRSEQNIFQSLLNDYATQGRNDAEHRKHQVGVNYGRKPDTQAYDPIKCSNILNGFSKLYLLSKSRQVFKSLQQSGKPIPVSEHTDIMEERTCLDELDVSSLYAYYQVLSGKEDYRIESVVSKTSSVNSLLAETLENKKTNNVNPAKFSGSPSSVLGTKNSSADMGYTICAYLQILWLYSLCSRLKRLWPANESKRYSPQ